MLSYRERKRIRDEEAARTPTSTPSHRGALLTLGETLLLSIAIPVLVSIGGTFAALIISDRWHQEDLRMYFSIANAESIASGKDMTIAFVLSNLGKESTTIIDMHLLQMVGPSREYGHYECSRDIVGTMIVPTSESTEQRHFLLGPHHRPLKFTRCVYD